MIDTFQWITENSEPSSELFIFEALKDVDISLITLLKFYVHLDETVCYSQ